MLAKISIAATIFLLLSLFVPISLAQETYVIQRAVLTVYRDGVVHVAVEASVDESELLITLPLLSPQETVDNIVVFDENNEPLMHDLGEKNITVYCLGASRVTLEYDTNGLTSKEIEIWTLRLIAPFNLTVIFPENTTIIYFNDVPSAIRTRGNIIEVDLYPGEWEIEYEIPIQPPPPTSDQQRQQPVPIEYIIIVGIIVVCLVALTLLYVRRRKISKALRDEEAEVIRFIRERGGRALEAELRERFPHIPRTSMWRLIRRLEKQGVVRVRKVGLQNVVELK